MKYDIKVNVGPLLAGVQGYIDAAVLPTLHQAVKALAMETAYRWKDGVAKAKLWQGEKQPYIDSIRWMMTGDFSALVSTDYELAEAIETGRPSRDLKKMLDTSMKVRLAKGGKHAGARYLVVPIRHNTPGNVALAQAMPQHVYDKALKLDASKVLGMGTRVSGTGAWSMKTKAPATVPQAKYKWGDRLPAGTAPKLKEHHATDPYAGMVRMNTSTAKKKSSAYLTFRVMGEWSTGWIIPAKPGLHIAKKVQGEIAAEAPKVFEQAIKHLK